MHPAPDIEQKIPNSGLHFTFIYPKSAGLVRVVHVIPSGDVITLFPVPESATAQKRLNFGDQHTLFHELLAALDLVVHVIPSGDVITLSPVPSPETAQNKLNEEDQQTPYHVLDVGGVMVVSVVVEYKPTSFLVQEDRKTGFELYVYIFSLTYILPPTPTPPDITTLPDDELVDTVVPPIYTSFPIPTPPATVNAPVVVLVD
jgi:hypothetical protein